MRASERSDRGTRRRRGLPSRLRDEAEMRGLTPCEVCEQ